MDHAEASYWLGNRGPSNALALFVVSGVAAQIARGLLHHYYKPFYLPGKAGTHKVLDMGSYTVVDYSPPVRVPAGRVFVLGDNRVRTADSRVPAADGGVGFVPLSAIMGMSLYVHWSSDRWRIGTKVNP